MYDDTHAWCPFCQEKNCMKVGGPPPATFYLDMVGQLGYTCRYCGAHGWGPGSSPWLICSFEPGPIRYELDGAAWCAKRPETFKNLQESLAGFGATRVQACKNLLEQESYQDLRPSGVGCSLHPNDCKCGYCVDPSAAVRGKEQP